MEVVQLLGSVLGLSFVAGINLYATVLAVGLGIKYGLLHLPPELSALSVLSHHYVLIAAAVAYLAEFVADKIPWVDSFWDSFHTVIRPVGAAVIGITAIGHLDPPVEVALFLLCGGVALSSHSTKAGVRFVANHSPEPVTNISLSIVEDLLTFAGSWLAVSHPLFMLGLVLSFLVIFALVAPKLFRLLRFEVLALLALIRSSFAPSDSSGERLLYDAVTEHNAEHLPHDSASTEGFCIRCASGKGIETGKNHIGFLCLSEDSLSFIVKKRLRSHRVRIDLSEVDRLTLQRGLLFDRLFLDHRKKRLSLYLFKDGRGRGERIVNILETLRQSKARQAEAPAS